ncbi:hypothetical protein PR048_008243 [Dryococelus australis]|uniref:Uncharacterized protein n=1 Tax=Dryococelus australis TaxID=614101 RepID=A0ABQ9HWJ2_9NEOP|nr:hypothetical protein PR048_008243 [Dryococelus australis]
MIARGQWRGPRGAWPGRAPPWEGRVGGASRPPRQSLPGAAAGQVSNVALRRFVYKQAGLATWSPRDKIDFKRVYTEVTFAIVSEFIIHTLYDSAPIADLQGNKKRIPYCQMWGSTRLAGNEQTSEDGAALECKGGGNVNTPRKPPASGIVQHDSHMQKFGSEPAGCRTRIAVVGGERPSHCATAAPEKVNQFRFPARSLGFSLVGNVLDIAAAQRVSSRFPVSTALAFRHCSMLNSFHPHQRSRTSLLSSHVYTQHDEEAARQFRYLRSGDGAFDARRCLTLIDPALLCPKREKQLQKTGPLRRLAVDKGIRDTRALHRPGRQRERERERESVCVCVCVSGVRGVSLANEASCTIEPFQGRAATDDNQVCGAVQHNAASPPTSSRSIINPFLPSRTLTTAAPPPPLPKQHSIPSSFVGNNSKHSRQTSKETGRRIQPALTSALTRRPPASRSELANLIQTAPAQACITENCNSCVLHMSSTPSPRLTSRVHSIAGSYICGRKHHRDIHQAEALSSLAAEFRYNAQQTLLQRKEFGTDSVVDDDHLSGEIRGIAHRKCNLTFRLPKKQPVGVFDYLQNYDAHFLI